jgi:lysophospholipase L1-like esterase
MHREKHIKFLTGWHTLCVAGLINLCVLCVAASPPETDDLKYVQADRLMIIGKGFDTGTEKYGRLPTNLPFRKSLTELGRQSAGIAIRFATDSKRIAVKWTLTGDNNMNHMPATGIKGLDLYSLENDNWHYRGTAIPAGKTTSGFFNHGYSPLVKGYTGEMKEYIAYLPLYDGVESLEIGIDKDADIGVPAIDRITRNEKARPIVFYGTSITQGGCASRPGMAYPAILGRMLHRETINLGFSGNGKLDFSIAKAIADIDAEAVVIDCLPNCNDAIVNDSAYHFISHLAKTRPNTKIFMVEYPLRPVFHTIYQRLAADGYGNITYIRAAGFLGEDGEATVDGVHFTDLGFYRYAHALYPILKEIINPQ